MQQQQFIDLQDQLNVFQAIFCPSSGAQDWDFYSIWYLVVVPLSEPLPTTTTGYHML